MDPIRIFVSSTTTDLKEFREFTVSSLHGPNLIPVAMEEWPPDARSAMEQITQLLTSSDLYLGIFAWRYGSVLELPNEHGLQTGGRSKISFAEFEYLLAKKHDLPRIIFLTDPKFRLEIDHIDVDRQDQKDFREGVEAESSVNHFASSEDFRVKFCRWAFQALQKTAAYKGFTREAKALLEIGFLMRRDLAAREAELARSRISEEKSCAAVRDAKYPQHRWFISEVGRCNLGERYIVRSQAQKDFAHWLVRPKAPICLLVGSSGIGKTNFLIDEIRYFLNPTDNREDLHNVTEFKEPEKKRGRSVLFFPLKTYRPSLTLGENLHRYLRARATVPSIFNVPKLPEKLEELVRTGDLLLVLDGLDELARQRSQRACKNLVERLTTLTRSEGPDKGVSASIVISCRDHIYKRLRHAGVFCGDFAKIELDVIDSETLNDVLAHRFEPGHVAYNQLHDPESPIRALARHPLLFELLCQIPRSAWRELAHNPKPARLYDFWFNETMRIVSTKKTSLDFEQVIREVARLMLTKREDILPTSDLESVKVLRSFLAFIRTTPDDRFSVFVRQTKNEWGFVHDSFREYALAKIIQRELASCDFKLLSEIDSLDYVGAETFRFVNELLPLNAELLNRLSQALDSFPRSEVERWNNVVQNCFEVLGMAGEEEVEEIIDLSIRLLSEKEAPLTNRTRYNIVRCLERMHPSAPRPYWGHMLQRDWQSRPNERRFGAAAVRGFHLVHPRIGYSPPIELVHRTVPSPARQKQVSDLLVSLLDGCAASRQLNAGLLEINCTWALTRWLHATHVDRVTKLHGRLTRESLGNLFQAFLRLPERASILRGRGLFFDGMYLTFVGPEFGRLSLPDFVVKDVTFLETREWKKRFENSIFVNSRRMELGQYEPSCAYEPAKSTGRSRKRPN